MRKELQSPQQKNQSESLLWRKGYLPQLHTQKEQNNPIWLTWNVLIMFRSGPDSSSPFIEHDKTTLMALNS